MYVAPNSCTVNFLRATRASPAVSSAVHTQGDSDVISS